MSAGGVVQPPGPGCKRREKGRHSVVSSYWPSKEGRTENQSRSRELSISWVKTWTPARKQNKRKSNRKQTFQKKLETRLLRGDGTVPRDVVVRTSHARANYVIREIVQFDDIKNSTVPTFGALTFTFADLPNASAWASVFDRYRFLGVKVTFQAVGVMMNTAPNTFSVPEFATIVDFDDNSAPTSFNQMQRYSTYCGHRSSSSIVRHFLPRATRPVYISGVSTGYQESDPMSWNDLAYTNIPHYGVKWGMREASPTAQAGWYQVICEYLIEVAGQRG